MSSIAPKTAGKIGVAQVASQGPGVLTAAQIENFANQLNDIQTRINQIKATQGYGQN